MKSIFLIFTFLIILFTIIIIFFSFNKYKSAFEADQACHAEQWLLYQDQIAYGCDHDLETDQWILFEAGVNHQAAKVIKRFKY